MGKLKQKWTQEEENALIAGVKKHGAGRWMDILSDPKFKPILASRSNVDIKDKWRNLNVRSSSRLPRLKLEAAVPARDSEVAVGSDQSQTDQGVKNRQRLPKLKAVAAPASKAVAAPASKAVAAPASKAVAAPPSAAAHSSEVAVSAPSQCDQDVKNPPGYNDMILEAVSTLKDANGSDLNAIFRFIKEKHNVPESFKRQMTTRLRGLVNQGMLEKVRTLYKIKKEASSESNDPAVKEAADTAARSVADAEDKSYLADEAVKEMEAISLLAEQNELMKRLTMDYYRKCLFEAVRHPK